MPKISLLPADGAVTGADLFAGVQAGVTYKINATQLAAFMESTLTVPAYVKTWNASANTPALVSSVGIAGTLYAVNVSGSTNLDGISSWNVGDYAYFNGSVWLRLQNENAGFTQGSVIFANASGQLSEDNNNFYWDEPTTTLAIGGNHGINGTVSDAFLSGNMQTVTNDNAGVLHGQGNISEDGNRNFLHGSSNLFDTCNDSGALGCVSVTFNTANASGAIGSTSCQNNGYDNVVFVGGLSSESNADEGILMGRGVQQAPTHEAVFMWGDGQLTTFTSVAANAWHIRAQGGFYLTSQPSVTADAESLFTLDDTDRYVKLTGGTSSQMNALSPTEKALFYNTTAGEYYFANGTSWGPISTGSGIEGSLATQWGGIFSTPVSGSQDVLYRKEGSFVTITLPEISDDADTSDDLTSVGVLPASVRPSSPVFLSCQGADNGNFINCQVVIDVTGEIIISADFAGASFSGSSLGGPSGIQLSGLPPYHI